MRAVRRMGIVTGSLPRIIDVEDRTGCMVSPSAEFSWTGTDRGILPVKGSPRQPRRWAVRPVAGSVDRPIRAPGRPLRRFRPGPSGPAATPPGVRPDSDRPGRLQRSPGPRPHRVRAPTRGLVGSQARSCPGPGRPDRARDKEPRLDRLELIQILALVALVGLAAGQAAGRVARRAGRRPGRDRAARCRRGLGRAARALAARSAGRSGTPHDGGRLGGPPRRSSRRASSAMGAR